MDRRVETVIKIMRANFEKPLSAEALAKAVNLSTWRFRHLFKSETNVAPLQYLRGVRMERAKYLLETTFLSVKQIAYMVGITDQSHFVRDFKARYGLSPVAHRRSFARMVDSNPG